MELAEQMQVVAPPGFERVGLPCCGLEEQLLGKMLVLKGVPRLPLLRQVRDVPLQCVCDLPEARLCCRVLGTRK